MVGSAIFRKLDARGAETIVRSVQSWTFWTVCRAKFMEAEKPDAVVLAAGKVGGIHANDTSTQLNSSTKTL